MVEAKTSTSSHLYYFE